MFLEELGNDVLRRRPKLMAFHAGQSPICPQGFHINDYLLKTGWHAQYMKEYTLVETFDAWRVADRPVAVSSAPKDEYLPFAVSQFYRRQTRQVVSSDKLKEVK
jgi:hypothetical protein